MSPLTLKLGRLVRVILLAIICDHPAMCKVSGFADHAHNMAPCTKCEVTQAELFSEKSLRNGTCQDWLRTHSRAVSEATWTRFSPSRWCSSQGPLLSISLTR